jgi:hypothetical protein
MTTGVEFTLSLRVGMAKAQEQFGNPNEGKRLPLEAGTRGLV